MTKEVLERMIQEFNENNERHSKLRAFIQDEKRFSEVDDLNKDLLVAQLKAMETYLSILSVRISLNTGNEVSD